MLNNYPRNCFLSNIPIILFSSNPIGFFHYLNDSRNVRLIHTAAIVTSHLQITERLHL